MNEKWEVTLLVEYLEEFIVAVTKGIEDQSVEQAMDIIKRREALVTHICTELGIKDE